ncbi:Vesicle transport protein GOT1B [Halotydeus destructor]|nr:Vesicle transport protein GOT1B [Halotydeus destructor]
MFEVTDFQKIGIGLAGFGVSFLFLGVLLMFDKGLLAIGNILFIAGLAFIIGFERTFWFFFQKHKWKGSTAFFAGMLVVLFGWPLVGMIVETYGFILLFGGFIPSAIGFLRRVPVLGMILSLPGISTVCNKLEGAINLVELSFLFLF